MDGKFPAINAYKEKFLQDFQQFKLSGLNETIYLSKNIITSGILNNNL